MKIQFFTKDTNDVLTNVYARIFDSHNYDVKIKTPVVVYSDSFKNGGIKVPRIASQTKINDCTEKQKLLLDLYGFLFERLQGVAALDTKTAKKMVNSFVLGEQNESIEQITTLYRKMLQQRNLAPTTVKKFRTLLYAIEDYEQTTGCTLTTENFTEQTVSEILQGIDTGERGRNTVAKYQKTMRTFCLWLEQNHYAEKRLFTGKVVAETYGTPYYLTQDERNLFATAELPKALAVQRDIFIFQCYIGCRVSDLVQFTKSNINGDFLEYIADKTKAKPRTIKVPLAAEARKLIAKYSSDERETLFPFISPQKYNKAIHQAAKLAGLNRHIPVVNPRTGQKEFRVLHEIISSHCARRTFVGILYKKTKDVNVIASMSGHTENSRAFSRYRAIDDDDKRELIDLL